jgi:hypothetical protein
MIPRSLQITLGLLLISVLVAGIYIHRLRRQAEEDLQRRVAQRPVQAPVSEPEQTAHFVVAYDADAVVRQEDKKVALSSEPNARAQQLLRFLLSEYAKQPSPHALGEGADVREVYITRDGLFVVDLNSELAQGQRSGVLAEELTIASLAGSLQLNFPGMKQIEFLVEGKPQQTLAGHFDLSRPLQSDQITQLLAELQ